LKEDIAKNGLIEPIWTFKIRSLMVVIAIWLAMEVGVDPVFIEWRSVNGTSLIDFVFR
jgi:hypothetical protein